VLGEARWRQLHEVIGSWANRPEGSLERQVYDEAAARVQASRPDNADAAAYSSEELFPYAVQVAMELGVQPTALMPNNSVQGWLARVRAALRSVFEKLTGQPGLFESQYLVDLAFALAQRDDSRRYNMTAERAGKRQTGATGPVADEDAWSAAERIYTSIRANALDVSKISQNTGIKPANIKKIKEHIFFKKHLLDRYRDYGVPSEWRRFDASPEMAESWLRLTAGTYTEIDLALLRHEAAESWFMRKHGPSYLDAHSAADRRYPSPY
jgi:hypothetical protein